MNIKLKAALLAAGIEGLDEAKAEEIAKQFAEVGAVEVDQLVTLAKSLRDLSAPSVDAAVHATEDSEIAKGLNKVGDGFEAFAKSQGDAFKALTDGVALISERVVELTADIKALKAGDAEKTAELTKSLDGLKDHINAPRPTKSVESVLPTEGDKAAAAAAAAGKPELPVLRERIVKHCTEIAINPATTPGARYTAQQKLSETLAGGDAFAIAKGLGISVEK